MSARKKGSKSSSKKLDESASKSKNISLIALFKEKTASYLDAPQCDNLTAEILEALLEKEANKLDLLLSQWGHDVEAVQHVVENLIESKIPLFTQRVAEILEKDQSKIYVFPWIEEIYAKYHSKVTNEISERLQKIVKIEAGETEKLMRLQGKLSLILQQ